MRERILPPYLDTPVWNQLVEAIDEAFAAVKIDDSKRQLQLLRVPVTTSDPIFTVDREDGRLTKLEDVETQERDSIIQQAKLLGFNFQTSTLFQVSDYLRMAQYIAAYYAETKGTEKWQDFLGFCINANFEVKNLWTTDYVTFYEEGDPAIGFAIYDGGAWYPTTHVVLGYDPSKFGSLDSTSVREFFYYFANINLVLDHIALTIEGTIQLLVSMGGYLEIQV